MRIGKNASDGRKIPKLPNLRAKFWFSKLKRVLEICLSFSLNNKFQKLHIWKIQKISQILQLRKSSNF